jgi:hypothetical protein
MIKSDFGKHVPKLNPRLFHSGAERVVVRWVDPSYIVVLRYSMRQICNER